MGSSCPIPLPAIASEVEKNSECLQDSDQTREDHKTENDNSESLEVQTHSEIVSRCLERFHCDASKLQKRIA